MNFIRLRHAARFRVVLHASVLGSTLVASSALGATGTTADEGTPPQPPAPSPETAGASQAPVDLQMIVVTARPSGQSKMRSSISVSTLDSQQIDETGATSVADLLRSIPGIRAESSGGESNANLVVRGVPLSAGGARYVQYQEDGLPILQFGDIAFATPDSFLRLDSLVDRLEVVRGGSASTLATGAPGGLVNFISEKGARDGGHVRDGVRPRLLANAVRGGLRRSRRCRNGLPRRRLLPQRGWRP